MAFNVKNEATLKLAREIANQTGDSIATVIDESVRARHEQALRTSSERRTRIDRIVAQTSAILRTDPLPEHGAVLYDETGLPA